MNVEAAMRRAVALHQAGKLVQAERAYARVIGQAPAFADALHLQGVALSQLGRHETALAALEKALRRLPDNPQVHHNYGKALQAAGRLEVAELSFKQALELAPNMADAWGNLGNLHKQRERYRPAIDCYQRALRLRPDWLMALNNLGNALQGIKQHEAALVPLRRAVALKPDYADAHSNFGNALLALKRPRDALAHYQQALALNPDSAEFHLNHGNALNDLDRPEEAEASYRQSLKLDGEQGRAWTSLGNALHRQRRWDEGRAAYEKALVLTPEDASAHFNIGIHLLHRGVYRRGWAEYEWGLQTDARQPYRDFKQPRWRGESYRGETLLVYAEQGIGDTLQFLRYLPMAKQRGGRLLFECQQRLLPLLKSCAGPDEIVERRNDGRIGPHFDRFCALMSLPHLLDLEDAIPADLPYLAPGAQAVEKSAWLEQEPGFKIGIAWTGNALNSMQARRSMPLRLFKAIAELPGVRLYSLLYDEATAEIAHIDFPLIDLSLPWDETAAVIRRLDLVISVDTSIAHLAGALNVPLWVLLPEPAEWRWQSERSDSPWYPQARLFRQNEPGNWDSVIAQVATALAGKLSQEPLASQ